MKIYPNRAVLMASGAAMALGGCMVPAELTAPYPVEQRAAPVESVPPLPDYRGGYRPDATVGWSGNWDRGAAQRPETASDYYLIDAADGLAQAIGDSPPDFAFRFDGRDAWIWLSNEGEAMIVEPSPYGVIQYYYAPRAAAPYLVRDVYQSYAYDGPDLVATYGQDGRLDRRLPSPRTLASAERLQARGRAIMAASFRRRWDDSVATSWSVQTFSGFGFGDSYGSGIGRGWSGGWQPRWRDRRDWSLERERRRDRDARRRLEEEARDRADNAERFRQWRREGRRGSAPSMRRGQPTGSYGVDSFVPPVTPPARRPGAGSGPTMTGSGDDRRQPRDGEARRGDLVPPGPASPTPPTGSPPPVVTVPEEPRIGRRPRPAPTASDQPTDRFERPAVIDTIDDSAAVAAREAAMRDAAAREAEAAERGRRERATALAAEQAIAAEAELARERQAAERAQAEAEQREQAQRQADMEAQAQRQAEAAAREQARSQAEAEAREAERQALAQEAQRRAEAEAQERAEARAAAAAEAAAARAAEAAQAAAQAAADAAEARRSERRSDGEEENVRPD